MRATAKPRVSRRLLLGGAGSALAALLGVPAWARPLPRMTEGPFYPPLAYRARSVDWDADLTVVRARAPDGQPLARAAGEHLDLLGVLEDGNGRPIDAAEVEIWQCDAFGSYRHPRGAGPRIDPGFQGFGSTRSDRAGAFALRTIRPVPYPGRTPHIHVKLRHPAFGETTSQLFVAGDPGNAGDFVYRSLAEADRAAAELHLERAPAGAAVVWIARSTITLGA